VPDLKISGLTAATQIDPTDEFVINDTATAGVSGSSKRVTAAMMADVVKRTAIGDAAYTILPADRLVVTSVAFTAARTWTLPAANAIPAGARIVIIDEIRTITATNTLTVARAGSDTIEGGTASIVLASGGASVGLISDGVSRSGRSSRKSARSTFRFSPATAPTRRPLGRARRTSGGWWRRCWRLVAGRRVLGRGGWWRALRARTSRRWLISSPSRRRSPSSSARRAQQRQRAITRAVPAAPPRLQRPA
jgi:hypothetical protein